MVMIRFGDGKWNEDLLAASQYAVIHPLVTPFKNVAIQMPGLGVRSSRDQGERVVRLACDCGLQRTN